MEKTVNTKELIHFAKKLEGQQLTTLARKIQFAVLVTNDGLEYVPSTTGIPRKHGQKWLDRFCDEFNKTQSFTTTDYTHLSVNASYALAVISLYLKD